MSLFRFLDVAMAAPSARASGVKYFGAEMKTLKRELIYIFMISSAFFNWPLILFFSESSPNWKISRRRVSVYIAYINRSLDCLRKPFTRLKEKTFALNPANYHSQRVFLSVGMFRCSHKFSWLFRNSPIEIEVQWSCEVENRMPSLATGLKLASEPIDNSRQYLSMYLGYSVGQFQTSQVSISFLSLPFQFFSPARYSCHQFPSHHFHSHLHRHHRHRCHHFHYHHPHFQLSALYPTVYSLLSFHSHPHLKKMKSKQTNYYRSKLLIPFHLSTAKSLKTNRINLFCY